MTTSNATASRRADTRHETKVAPNLYRQVGTDRYRFAKMVRGVSVFERFAAPTLTEAKQYADTLRTRKTSDIGDKSVTLRTLVDGYLALGEKKNSTPLAPRSIEVRRLLLEKHVLPALGEKTKAVDVTTPHLRRMVSKLRKDGLSGATIHAAVSATSGIFWYGKAHLGAVATNPVNELDGLPSAARQSEPRYLSLTEVRRLLDKMSDESRPVASACFWGALRVSEALALRWQDIDFEGRKIHVPGSKTKASKATIRLLPELAYELRAHRVRQGEQGFERIAQTAVVFQTATGLSPGRRNILRAVTNAGRRAGLQPEGAQPVGVHDLRHSFAAYALNGGISMLETSIVLRHRDSQVTAKFYAGLTDEALDAIGSKLEAIGAAV
jgi:integrase